MYTCKDIQFVASALFIHLCGRGVTLYTQK